MKISIITTTFNSASFIDDCLASVKKQTFKEIQHIIIDGSSSDETLKILNSRRDQISDLVSEPDRGIYDAMNKGIKLAKGDIIGILNSDDFYPREDILENVIREFKRNPFLDACYADLVYVDRKNLSKNIRYWKSSKFIPGSFSKAWCPPHPTFFVRRSVYENFGSFDTNYQISADFELMFRFLEINKIVVHYVPEVWVKMRTGGKSNKSLKNIFFQNQEIIRVFNNYRLKINLINFFFYKVLLRIKQFLIKPKK